MLPTAYNGALQTLPGPACPAVSFRQMDSGRSQEKKGCPERPDRLI